MGEELKFSDHKAKNYFINIIWANYIQPNKKLNHIPGTGDALWCCNGTVLIAAIGKRSDARALSDIQQKLQTNGDTFKIVAVRLVDDRQDRSTKSD
ncbi:unnamed protein product [Haemonchus placei]|uniref:PPM-type phosphatase domain-containing protein n=1 Tax=Haemonchus placei TaxID=6290 RepID=A0A0N4W8T3_HAEPC|nr:unnamed protein product [Haemonchus placei]